MNTTTTTTSTLTPPPPHGSSNLSSSTYCYPSHHQNNAHQHHHHHGHHDHHGHHHHHGYAPLAECTTGSGVVQIGNGVSSASNTVLNAVVAAAAHHGQFNSNQPVGASGHLPENLHHQNFSNNSFSTSKPIQ